MFDEADIPKPEDEFSKDDFLNSDDNKHFFDPSKADNISGFSNCFFSNAHVPSGMSGDSINPPRPKSKAKDPLKEITILFAENRIFSVVREDKPDETLNGLTFAEAKTIYDNLTKDGIEATIIVFMVL